MNPLLSHLLESTLFAAGVGVLAMVLRRNTAAVRYRLWMAASLKFVVPFSLLVSAGSHFGRPAWLRSTPALTPSRSNSIPADVLPPPSRKTAPTRSAPELPSAVAALLPWIWLAGVAVSAAHWYRQWHRVCAAARRSTPFRLDPPLAIPARLLAPADRLEPGVFGIYRPVLLLPAGIAERLTPTQLESVLAHELCHVERRDNLTAAFHLAIETLFWFYPLLRWIRARLIEERERACDEAALAREGHPEEYAEGILEVCRLYLESPLPCAAGVTGSTLKERIRLIMANRNPQRLSRGWRVSVAAAGIAAIAGPLFQGMMNAPLHAQAQSTSLTFEVASVKANHSQDLRGEPMAFLPGGRFTAQGVPLYMLVAAAYDVSFQSPRLSGGPDWLRSPANRYDVEAKAPQGVITPDMPKTVRNAKMRQMLQNLLADRFKLKVVHETKELPAYVLVVGKGGPKLTPSKVAEKDCSEDGTIQWGVTCHTIMGGMGRGMHAKAVTTTDMAQFVENWADRPVLDKTGLTGLYEVETEGWAPMRPRPPRPDGQPNAEDLAMADPTRLTLFTVFERLGLKLESQKAPVEVYVIDHAERPTEN